MPSMSAERRALNDLTDTVLGAEQFGDLPLNPEPASAMRTPPRSQAQLLESAHR